MIYRKIDMNDLRLYFFVWIIFRNIDNYVSNW